MSICDSVTLSGYLEMTSAFPRSYREIIVQGSPGLSSKYFHRDTCGLLDTASRDLCIQAHKGCTTIQDTNTCLILLDTLGNKNELGRCSLKSVVLMARSASTLSSSIQNS